MENVAFEGPSCHENPLLFYSTSDSRSLHDQTLILNNLTKLGKLNNHNNQVLKQICITNPICFEGNLNEDILNPLSPYGYGVATQQIVRFSVPQVHQCYLKSQ